MARGGLASRSPITHGTQKTPCYQTRSPSPHNHRKGITVPAQGNNRPGAIASARQSLACSRSLLHHPQRDRQRLPQAQAAAPTRATKRPVLATMASPSGVRHGKGCGMGDFAPGTVRLRFRQRKPLGRQGHLPGHPHVPIGAASCPPSPRTAWGHGSHGTWGPGGISPTSCHGGPGRRSTVIRAAPGDFCHRRAYTFHICLSFFLLQFHLTPERVQTHHL